MRRTWPCYQVTWIGLIKWPLSGRVPPALISDFQWVRRSWLALCWPHQGHHILPSWGQLLRCRAILPPPEVSWFVSGFLGWRKEHPAVSRLFGVLCWRDREPTWSFAESVKGMKILKRKKRTMGKMSATNNVLAPSCLGSYIHLTTDAESKIQGKERCLWKWNNLLAAL